MKYTVLVLIVAIATSRASVIGGYLGGAAALVGPANPGATLKGPAAHATVVGPDGSSIAAASDSGAIVAAPIPGGVVTSAVVPGLVAPTHPVVWGAPATLTAPAIVGNVGTVIDGPSGIIKTAGNPFGYIGAAHLGHHAGLVAPWGVAPWGVAPYGVGHGFGFGHHGVW